MLRRVDRLILRVPSLPSAVAYYRDVLGLKQVTDDKGWREFDAGGVTVALHSGPASPGAGQSEGPLGQGVAAKQ